MKTKTTKSLPKTIGEITTGGVYLQRVRCGKSNCKCARGDTHTAYYFFASRDGKLTKTYIRKSQVKAFSRLVDRAAAERKRQRRTDKSGWDSLRQLRQSLRERDSIIHSLKEGSKNDG